MVNIRRVQIDPPLVNSSCPWSSELDQLQELFDCPRTGAVTTRTATLTGFAETPEHGVVFTRDTLTSQNSYGYSPHPLAYYIDAVRAILRRAPPESTKPIIISITSSSPISLSTMLDAIQSLRTELSDSDASVPASRIAVELNTSCPNITGSPPPAYTPSTLAPLLRVLARHHAADPTLVLGIKLPPYTYSTQFAGALEVLEAVLPGSDDGASPIAFITATNTLGQTLLFDAQVEIPSSAAQGSPYALSTPLGGLAGDALHALALGNVYTFRRLLDAHPRAEMRAIAIVGVGGVTSRDAHRRMREVGAAVVACATFFGRHGVQAFEMLSLEGGEGEREDGSQ